MGYEIRPAKILKIIWIKIKFMHMMTYLLELLKYDDCQ